jgi:hypothetical protein
MKRKPKIEVTDSFLAEQGHTRESYEQLSKAGRWSVRNREKHYEMCKKTVAKKPEHYSSRHRKYCLMQNYILPINCGPNLKDKIFLMPLLTIKKEKEDLVKLANN